MKRTITICTIALAAIQLPAQQPFTANDVSTRSLERKMQYYPDGEDFVCINGNNRFTRALYGTHTLWRLETSDRPVFAVYNKSKNFHIAFKLECNGKTIALDSTEYCEGRYTPGKRVYSLKDADWKKGALQVTAIPLADKEGAIWHFTTTNMPKTISLLGQIGPIKANKLSRAGDLGVDKADSFEASPDKPHTTNKFSFEKGEGYILYEDGALRQLSMNEGKAIYDKAEKARAALTARFKITTPDPYINTLGGALAAAADGIWDEEVWLHGANAWRMPLSGWRAAYTGDCLGWHDRARTHFNNYATSQVTEVEPIYPHPMQDSTLNLARAAKKWGTQMYSNGYICRNPNRNDQMHHYDMNLCYIDELLWHLCWTGDLDYARKMWPVITRHLAWEKRNFDPDNDGLYDAYCCIWASDALYYNSGAVTHSSAYNYRANKIAAEIAKLIGEDGSKYAEEAERIKAGLQKRLWMNDKGVWAEFQDLMGNKDLHTSPAVWTIYHAIDSEVSDIFQYYQATRYIDRSIPRIPVTGEGLEDNGYYTISTTNWMPYSWSINNVAFAEVWHTALSYWQAGRPDEAFHIFKSSVLDGMYLGHCPGNFGQISHYDAARGECYRDFGDPIGMAARALTQGLFGIYPDLLNSKFNIRTGFPKDWNNASLSTSYIDFSFMRNGDVETYNITPRLQKQANIVLTIPAYKDSYASVTVNGKTVVPTIAESIEIPRITLQFPAEKELTIEIRWKGETISYERAEYPLNSIKGNINDGTYFVAAAQGMMKWWKPVEKEQKEDCAFYGTLLPVKANAEYETINMDNAFNANVTDIFRNSYESPRSPYTTLQIPKQGIGEWCHPKDSAVIDDSGFRKCINGGIFRMPQGIPFRTPAEGKNIAFTTLWDNYPNAVSIPLSGKATGIYLLLAGSTNHMQCRHTNGTITVNYADGSSEQLPLVNPNNWAPIEQDFYFDDYAFKNETPRPYRVVLSSGLVSNNLEKDLNLKGFNSRAVSGGAATVLYLPLDCNKSLRDLNIEAHANDVVIGIMGATIVIHRHPSPTH